MSKLYLHKINGGKINTRKSTIVADLSKYTYSTGTRVYKYQNTYSRKKPEEFILKGNPTYSSIFYNLRFCDFPVKRVFIDRNIHMHDTCLINFYNAKELEFGKNANNIEIYNSFGLRKLEKIIIPFSIENFTDNYAHGDKLKTILIKHENEVLTLEIDDVFADRIIDLNIHKVNNMLKVYITSIYSNIRYDVYLKDDKLEYTKNYLSYEIKPNEEKELDLIKLKEEYNCKLKPYLKLEKEKVILSKDDYIFLNYLDKSVLKELIIKDENDMSLFPREVKINDGIFELIEVYNNKVLIYMETIERKNKYMLINDDLSFVNFERNSLDKLNIYLDLASNNFSLEKNVDSYNLTIPYDEEYNFKDCKIIKHLIHIANNIYIKNKNKVEKIDKIINKEYLISDIKRYSDSDYIVYYDMVGLDETYQHVIYVYDEENFKYHKTLGKECTNYHEAEYKRIKNLIKK